MLKIFTFCLLFFITFLTFLRAEFYMSGSVGAATTKDIKMDVNEDLSFGGTSTSVSESTGQVLGMNVRTRTTQTTNYMVALKNLVFASKQKYNFTASSAIGYHFKKHFRFESEYRYIKFKSILEDGLADTNVDINVVADVFMGTSDTPMMSQEQNQHIEIPLDLGGLLQGYSGGLLPSSGGSVVPAVSFSHGAHLHFFNFLYEASLFKDFNVFGGLGLGYGFLSFYDANYPEGTDVHIKPMDSKYFAYQYKFGAYYKITNSVDFMVSYVDIKTIGNTNIGAFTYKPLFFQLVEFGFRYNFV